MSMQINIGLYIYNVYNMYNILPHNYIFTNFPPPIYIPFLPFYFFMEFMIFMTIVDLICSTKLSSMGTTRRHTFFLFFILSLFFFFSFHFCKETPMNQPTFNTNIQELISFQRSLELFYHYKNSLESSQIHDSL